jgi:hypothetical protein
MSPTNYKLNIIFAVSINPNNVDRQFKMRIITLTYHNFDRLIGSHVSIGVQVLVDGLADEVESTCCQEAVVLHVAPNLSMPFRNEESGVK